MVVHTVQSTADVCKKWLQSFKSKLTMRFILKKRKNSLRVYAHIIYLCCLPAPLPIFGIVSEPPHVPVGLDDLRPQDVVLLILPYGHRLQSTVELKGLRTKLQHFREEDEGGGWVQSNREIERWRAERRKGLIEGRKGQEDKWGNKKRVIDRKERAEKKQKMKVIGQTKEESKEGERARDGLR